MNKKLIRTLALALMLVLIGTVTVFADRSAMDPSAPFALVETSPKNDSADTVSQNVAIKLIFNHDVAEDAARKANDNIFKITTEQADENGKTSTYSVPYTELYNHDKYPNEIWLQCDEDLVTTQTYTVTIPGTMVSSDGQTLGSDQTLSFTIRNTKRDNTIYTIMMFAFMGLMIVLTVRDAAKQARGDNAKKKKDGPVNPYKEAKKKGKTVDQVNAELEKKKAKQAEKDAKREAMKAEIRKEIAEERKKAREKSRKKKYRVMRKAPISKAGYETPKAYRKK